MINKIKNRENGFTLVEMLVTIVILAVVAAGVTAVILQITNTAQKFTTSATSQNKAADAIASIGRDISSSTKITYADDWRVDLESVDNAQKYKVSIFYWSPGDASNVPDGVPTANLPTGEAIIEYRVGMTAGAGTGKINVLTEGYEKARQSKTLFTYFDSANKSLTTPISETVEANLIKRVEYQFNLKVANRASLIELSSSATPRSTADIKNGGVLGDNSICNAPTLSGTIPNGQRTANLKWTEVTGAANGYTVYRKNVNELTDDIAAAYIGSRTTTTHNDNNNGAGLTWGEQYRYAVAANCSSTVSVRSNELILYVVPDKTTIVNLNTKKELTDTLKTNPETGTRSTSADSLNKKYSVARGLVNQIVWLPKNGAINYKIYRDNVYLATTAGTEYKDTTTYGDTYTYKIAAVGQLCPTVANCGGEGAQSDEEQLISPPSATNFKSSTKNATPGTDATRPDTSTSSTVTQNNVVIDGVRAPNTTGFNAYRSAAATSAVSTCPATARYGTMDFTSTPVHDKDVPWGSTVCYEFAPYNDAGFGVTSSTRIDQYPGKFNIIGGTTFFNGTYHNHKNINENPALLPGGTQCWVDAWGNTYSPCNGGARSNTNKFALGLFSRSENSKTDINFAWAEAKNSYGGYTVSEARTASGGTVDQSAENNSYNAGYVAGNQSLIFKNEMPGSRFTFTVQAKAASGESRTASNINVVTPPDIPAEGHNIIQTKKTGADTFRTRTAIGTWVNRGAATSVVAVSDPGNVTQEYGIAQTVTSTYSAAYAGGNRGSYAYTKLSNPWSTGVIAASDSVGRYSSTNPGCTSAGLICGATHADIPEAYPAYFAGGHYRYFAGGNAASGANGGQGSNNPAPQPTTPQGPPAAVEGSGGGDVTCDSLNPSHPDWDLFGCMETPNIASVSTVAGSNFDLIPVINLEKLKIGATYTVDIKSTDYKGAYDRTSTFVATAATNSSQYPAAQVSRCKPFTVTVTGQVNAGSSSAVSSTYTSTSFGGQCTTVSIGDVRGYNLDVNGDMQPRVQFSGLTSGQTYNVRFVGTSSAGATNVGETFVASSATPLVSFSTAIKLKPETQIVITINGGTPSVYGTKTTSFAAGQIIPQPAAPANLVGDNRNGTTTITPSTIAWSVVTCTLGTPEYQLSSTSPTVGIVQDWSTKTNISQTLVPNTTYGYSVKARCQSDEGTSAESVAKTASITARYNAPSNPTAAIVTNAAAPFVGQSVNFTFGSTCYAGTTPSYQVYKNGTLVGTYTANPAAITMDTAGTHSYTYKIACASGGYTTPYSAGFSPATSIVVAASAAAPSVAPTASSTTPLVGQNVTFTFPSNTCAAGTTPRYTLYRNGVSVGTSTTTTLAVAQSTAGSASYTYSIECLTGGVYSPASPVSPATIVNVITAPAAPSNLTVTRIYGATTYFSWTAVPGATSYTLNYNGVNTVINSTATGTITATVQGKMRNTNFANGNANVQALPETFPVATVTAKDTYGYTSTGSTVSVDTPQQRLFANVHNGFVPRGADNPAGIDNRAGNSIVSADASQAFIIQRDRNMVTYKLSTGEAIWAASWYGVHPIDHWVFDQNGANAFYRGSAAAGWSLFWCGWGCGGADMYVLENHGGGGARSFDWNGSTWVFKGEHV